MTASTAREDVEQLGSVVIAPSHGWPKINLGEVWAHRELVYFLVWRDIKVRYRQTVFGLLWAVLQPLALVAVFALFLGRLSGIAPGNVSYPIFVLVALVPWLLVSKSVAAASESLVGASSLLQKVYFPRLVLPIAAVTAQIPDFLVMGALLVGALALSGAVVTPGMAVVVPLVAVALVLAVGLGCWLSALNVRFRDIRQVVPLGLQLWFFASPIAYSSSIVPGSWRAIYDLNPMVGIIDGFRWGVLNGPRDGLPASLLLSALVSASLLLSGVLFFRRVERTFADII